MPTVTVSTDVLESAKNPIWIERKSVTAELEREREYPARQQDSIVSKELSFFYSIGGPEAQYESLIQRWMMSGTLPSSDLEKMLVEPLSREGSANLTSQVEETLDQLLSVDIVIPQPAEVRDYLLRYPDMIDLLQPVCDVAREKFGMDAQLSLEVYNDPEIDNEHLTLYIRQRHYDEQIMNKIEDIWATYDEKLAERFGWLHVTTDFRPPR